MQQASGHVTQGAPIKSEQYMYVHACVCVCVCGGGGGGGRGLCLRELQDLEWNKITE